MAISLRLRKLYAALYYARKHRMKRLLAVSPAASTDVLLLEGGTDRLLLSGDEQTGTDVIQLSGAS